MTAGAFNDVSQLIPFLVPCDFQLHLVSNHIFIFSLFCANLRISLREPSEVSPYCIPNVSWVGFAGKPYPWGAEREGATASEIVPILNTLYIQSAPRLFFSCRILP